jgi:hypothetical protein
LDERRVWALQNSYVVDETTETTDRVCAPTEAEQKDFVTRRIVLHDVPVVIHDVLVQASPCRPSDDLVVIGAHTPIVENLLRDLVLRDRSNGTSSAEDVGGNVAF